MSASKDGKGALAVGGLAAILASTCCLGPLLLVTLGFSGAWIGNLTVLEPYRPIFIAAALTMLFFAYRRIFRPAVACRPDDVCAIPQVRSTYKIIFWVVAGLVLLALVYPYVLPLFY
ncbi:MAG: mercuric ion transporter MerT [Rhodanobacter sp.]|nr:MAG: mercuric ion transporter MerT [Rhodanobacter sp.]